MTRTRSLEEERNAILYRIQSSRDEYRELLGGPRMKDAKTGNTKAHRPRRPSNNIVDVPASEVVVANGHISSSHPVVEWIKAHPYLCIAIVGAAAALGPRRLMRVGRAGAKGVVSLAALRRRNSPNDHTWNRLIPWNTVATYLANRRSR
jgi:hypothetical protein